nr:carboxypeptidase-like regulatory domain-containing protein [Chitinophagaceae bacterium]
MIPFFKHCISRLLVSLLLLSAIVVQDAFAQDEHKIEGIVLDESKVPLEGVTVQLKESTLRTRTGVDGKFSIQLPKGKHVLVFSFVGKETFEADVTGQNTVSVTMKDVATPDLDQVVVVGYGKQKKQSMVAAITQTNGKVLERAGGVSNIGAALTGNVPGLITNASTGLPGAEDPMILIRGRSSWNNSDPLILVDGVERPMNSVDIASVETISVLKDASATAVFGSRGANGV